jgi:hypothetical protein
MQCGVTDSQRQSRLKNATDAGKDGVCGRARSCADDAGKRNEPAYDVKGRPGATL